MSSLPLCQLPWGSPGQVGIGKTRGDLVSGGEIHLFSVEKEISKNSISENGWYAEQP